MKYGNFLEIIPQVLTFVRPQNAQRQRQQGPDVDHRIIAAVMFAQLMNLGVAVVASRDAVVCPGRLDLVVLELPVSQALILEAGLQKTAPATAAIVVRFVGNHVDEIFFAHDRLDHEAQVIGNGVAVALAYDLARVLDRELDLQVLVPVRAGLEFALPDPPGVVFVDVLDDEVVRDVELFQSCQD